MNTADAQTTLGVDFGKHTFCFGRQCVHESQIAVILEKVNLITKKKHILGVIKLVMKHCASFPAAQ